MLCALKSGPGLQLLPPNVGKALQVTSICSQRMARGPDLNTHSTLPLLSGPVPAVATVSNAAPTLPQSLKLLISSEFYRNLF